MKLRLFPMPLRVCRATVDGSPGQREDRYGIERVSKVKGDLWNFEARTQRHHEEVEISMPLPVKWAGDTPVISLTNFTFAEKGPATTGVVIHDGNCAGTCSAGPTHGGKVLGKIVKNDAGFRPAGERSGYALMFIRILSIRHLENADPGGGRQSGFSEHVEKHARQVGIRGRAGR